VLVEFGIPSTLYRSWLQLAMMPWPEKARLGVHEEREIKPIHNEI
jgi:hypothetical protein